MRASVFPVHSNLPTFRKRGSILLGLCVLCMVAGPLGAAEGLEGVTAVSSRVSPDYVRAKNPDGSLVPEVFAFAKGGFWEGASGDPTIDNLDFMEIARVLSGPLAQRGYVMDRDPAKTKLLIMVYWGVTRTPRTPADSAAYQDYGNTLQQVASLQSNPSFGAQASIDAMMSSAMQLIRLENNIRDRIDYENANLLGYNSPEGSSWVGTAEGEQVRYSAMRFARDDLVQEVEVGRYFVILMAYDFQMAWKQKKHKLLWETRFSINQPRNDFGKALPAMAAYASQYFGKSSKGLVREEIKEGHVDIQAPTLIELGNRKGP
jgi:hypothetical protein